MKSLNLKTLIEKLNIKPVDLDNLRTAGFPLKKIDKPTYYDLIIRGNVAVTDEGVYICINGADYSWTLDGHKQPMMIMPSPNMGPGYECLHSDSYKDFFPYAYGRQDEFTVAGVFESDIQADKLKTIEDLERVYSEYELDKGYEYILKKYA